MPAPFQGSRVAMGGAVFIRRQRKAPKGGYRSPTTVLLAQARVQLQAVGQVRVPAKSWLDAASLYLTLQRSCRAVGEDETPVIQVEHCLGNEGWAWRWEGDDLVIDLPGWVQPAPVILAIQPGLFD